ncbi:MAG: two-component system, OmpR family, sensor kinase [Mycobacterium sp.]|nr:two-component system, OmpR family, sensor kinase [Mycobacterium sp.]
MPSLTFPDGRLREIPLAPQLTVTRTGQTALTIQADPTRVAQILSNLLDNARRHTPRGGQIIIDLTDQQSSVAGHLVMVTVTDTGHGVPEDERERIFERLMRLDTARTRDHGGAGLGLPSARALARAHGGDLICVSQAGGAQFRLTLPGDLRTHRGGSPPLVHRAMAQELVSTIRLTTADNDQLRRVTPRSLIGRGMHWDLWG